MVSKSLFVIRTIWSILYKENYCWLVNRCSKAFVVFLYFPVRPMLNCLQRADHCKQPYRKVDFAPTRQHCLTPFCPSEIVSCYPLTGCIQTISSKSNVVVAVHWHAWLQHSLSTRLLRCRKFFARKHRRKLRRVGVIAGFKTVNL